MSSLKTKLRALVLTGVGLAAATAARAEVALPAALSAIKEGFPIKIISGGTDGSSGFWVTRPGEAINKPEDLKGKRFVFSRPKSVSESTILAILKSYNIDPSEVKMVAIGDFGAGLTALEHNKADIAIIPEPIYYEDEGGRQVPGDPVARCQDPR